MTRSRALIAALFAAGLAACVEQAPDVPTEDDLKAARANILSAAPTPKLAVNANLEGRVTVLGCDVDTDVVEPGRSFTVTTYWKVNQTVSDGWRMFFHVNGAGGKTQFINHDHTPLQGKYPVSHWKPGETLRDIYKISLPGSWQGNEVDLYTGLWKGPLRMKVTAGPQDGDNRVLLAKLPVRGAATVSTGSVSVPGRKRYLARKVKTPPKIDGKLDDAAWKDAPWSEPFVATLTGQPMDQKTTVKMVYDDKNLYIAFSNADTDVWSDLTKHDDKLWTQEVDEVMIDADGDGKTYIELQVSPNGTTFDSYLPSYRQNQNDWESGMKAAVKVDGTLNKRDDTDKGWTVEIALPLAAAKGRADKGPQIPPKVGDMWRINLYRMDMPKGKPQVGSGWSPPLVGDFHALEKFGELVFADEKGAVSGQAAPAQTKAGAKPTLQSEPLPHGAKPGSQIVPMTAQPAAKSQGRK